MNRSFGDELDLEGEEIKENERNQNVEEDEDEDDGEFILDSTKGMRNMMQ